MKITLIFAVLFSSMAAHSSEVKVITKPATVNEIYESKVYMGFTRNERSYHVISHVGGVLKELKARSGQKIKAGQIIATLKPTKPSFDQKNQIITASTTGVIDSVNYKIGEYVKPLKPIATISGTKSLQSVEIFAPLSEAMSMNIGDKVEIALGAKSESHLPLKTTGEVIGISRRIDPSVASFPVTILIHCPKNREPQCRN